jgi:GDP-L-fucose synthase
MKIAVLGANGFIGSSLINCLSKKHTTYPITRNTLDLLNYTDVKAYLSLYRFDVIINAAATMVNNDGLYDTRNNLGLFMNFYNNHTYFGKFINIASGAEYDRTMNINEATENLIFERIPKDSYSFGQNIKSRLSAEKENFYNLRIFNCFGKGEISTRIFPKFLNKGNTEFHIQDDRYFDYFCVQDLCTVAETFVYNDIHIKDINCVYTKKYKISEVLKKFCDLNNLDPAFQVTSTSNNNYTGSGTLLSQLDIKLIGLDEGLLKYGDER